MVLDRSSTYTHTIGVQWFQNAVQPITAPKVHNHLLSLADVSGNFSPFTRTVLTSELRHTTKNIINNRLLLWQRGVQWFQTALQHTLTSLLKCLLFIQRKCS